MSSFWRFLLRNTYLLSQRWGWASVISFLKMITFFFGVRVQAIPLTSKFLGKSKLPKNWDRVPKRIFEKRKDNHVKFFLRSHNKFRQNIFNVIQMILFKAETECWRRLPAIFLKHWRDAFDVWWSGLWAHRGRKEN